MSDTTPKISFTSPSPPPLVGPESDYPPTPEPEREAEPTIGPYRKTAISVLTTISHASSAFISTFLLVHLSAPALANLGGSTLASQTMLLGREYYQTPLSEPLILLTPLTVHAVSGILRRCLSPAPKTNPSPITGALSTTGYSLAFLLLPIHYLTHRTYPTLLKSTIDAVGPAELDFEFVKYALQKFPLRSWALYVPLVAFTGIHAAFGVGRMYNYWNVGLGKGEGGKTKLWGKKERRRALGGAFLGVVAPVISGLIVLASEPAMVFGETASRYGAALRESFVYRI